MLAGAAPTPHVIVTVFKPWRLPRDAWRGVAMARDRGCFATWHVVPLDARRGSTRDTDCFFGLATCHDLVDVAGTRDSGCGVVS